MQTETMPLEITREQFAANFARCTGGSTVYDYGLQRGDYMGRLHADRFTLCRTVPAPAFNTCATTLFGTFTEQGIEYRFGKSAAVKLFMALLDIVWVLFAAVAAIGDAGTGILWSLAALALLNAPLFIHFKSAKQDLRDMLQKLCAEVETP